MDSLTSGRTNVCYVVWSYKHWYVMSSELKLTDSEEEVKVHMRFGVED